MLRILSLLCLAATSELGGLATDCTDASLAGLSQCDFKGEEGLHFIQVKESLLGKARDDAGVIFGARHRQITSGSRVQHQQPLAETKVPFRERSFFSLETASLLMLALFAICLILCLSIRTNQKAAGLDRLTERGKEIGYVEAQHGPAIPEALAEGGVVPLIHAQAAKHPLKAALIQARTGRTLTYGELIQHATKLAKAFRAQLEPGRGDVVGFLFEPSFSYVVAALAVLEARVVWLPLDVRSPGERLRHLVQRAGVRIICTTEGFNTSHIEPLPIWRLSDQGVLVDASAPALPVANLRDESAAVLFYTSGSSGQPKAVVYGPETICHGILTLTQLTKADSSSIWLMKSPPIWAVTEWELFCPLVVGGSTIVDAGSQFDLLRLSETIRLHNVSILVSTGPVMQLLIDERLPSLREMVNCGGPLTLETCQALHASFASQGLSVHNIYAATETPSLQWTFDASMDLVVRMAPAGQPQPGVEVLLVAAGTMTPVAENEPGEILIGGQFLSHGYFGDAALTAERFVSNSSGSRFYRTGDYGRWFSTSKGLLLQVEGRLDRQLNINGIRVSPEEVEIAILDAPGIQEVGLAVVGEEGSHKVVACVAGTGGGLSTVVLDHCSKLLPKHMIPSLVVELQSLPKLPNGKIDLRQLKEVAEKAWQRENNDQEAAFDSLGRMRMVKRSVLKEMQIMSTLRALATIGLIIYHWYFGAIGGFSHDQSRTGISTHEPYAFGTVSKGLFYCVDWTSMLFLCLSAYTDSKDPPQGLLKINFLVLLVYLVMAWPIPALFTALQHDLLQNNSFSAWDGNHRWYLKYYILCNLLHSFFFLPIRTNLARSSNRTKRLVPASIVLTMAVACFSLLDVFTRTSESWKLCADNRSSLASWLLLDKCDIIRWKNLPYLFVYSIVWWYGPSTFDCIRNGPLFYFLQRLGPLVIFSIIIPTALIDQSIIVKITAFSQTLINLLATCCLVTSVSLAADRWWFPLRFLAWLGNASFAGYIFHLSFVSENDGITHMTFFSFQNKVLIPPPEVLISSIQCFMPVAVLLKYLLLFTYPVIWMATFGILLQKLLVAISLFFDAVVRTALSLFGSTKEECT